MKKVENLKEIFKNAWQIVKSEKIEIGEALRRAWASFKAKVKEAIKNAWQTFTMNSNSIQTTTDRAVLIKAVGSDFVFWVPKKCVRFSGKNNYLITVSFTETFNFVLQRFGKGQYNGREVLEKIEVSGSEILEYTSK